MNGYMLVARETRDINHIQSVGFCQSDRFLALSVKCSKEGIGAVYKRVCFQVIAANRKGTRRKEKAPRLGVLSDIAEGFERKNYPLRGAPRDLRNYSDFG